MKALLQNRYIIAVIACLVLTLSACSNDDNPIANTSTPDGNWRISLYFDSGDETSNFSGYTFQFNNGGQLTATNGSNTVTGTWTLTSTKMVINFGTTPLFDDLNDDWLIEEKTASSIKLKEDNPAQDDKLQFTRL
jgi:hypothetical protein